MNERIKELIVESGNGQMRDGRLYPHIGIRFEEDWQRFALLIVRECVKEIEFQIGGGSDQPMDSEWDRAIECASSMVKYRFGVEE